MFNRSTDTSKVDEGKPSQRRGMLLLLVLLMLAMFLGIGAMLLTIATRARAAARATAASQIYGSVGDKLHRDALDEALMALIRGNVSSTTGNVTASGTIHESLLADKYGPPLTGNCTVTSTNSTIMTITARNLRTLSGSTVSAPGPVLDGRVITLIPARRSDQPRACDALSYRIIGASANPDPVCYVAQMPGSRTPRQLMTGTGPVAFDVFINGREYTPDGSVEAYDAPDQANPFLAQPLLNSGSFVKASFSGTDPIEVDNNNDGVNDGVWISGTVVSPKRSPLGGMLTFEVSYLVVDLDGRLNLNTAGSYLGTGTAAVTYPPEMQGPDFFGMGYGPADVPLHLTPGFYSPASVPVSQTLSSTSFVLLVGGTPNASLELPSMSQPRLPPRLGRIDGRYGWMANVTASPGQPGDDSGTEQITSASAYSQFVSGLGLVATGTYTIPSPTDLRGRMVVIADGTPAECRFYLPTGIAGTNADWIDDPYECRLDAGAGVFGVPRRSTTSAAPDTDSPYTLAELERLLRPNDLDASQLAPRLAAALGDSGKNSQWLYTTDSWDTPAITGAAASLLVSKGLANSSTQFLFRPTYPWLGPSSTSLTGGNHLSPDVAAGLRFDLNRAVLSGTHATFATITSPGFEAFRQQQLYCKGLYSLVRCIAPSIAPERAAQWAANVLDYRDNDSKMTYFLYTTATGAGRQWNASTVTGTTWGVERPDLVIKGVTTASGSTTITLFNPYRASVSGTAVELVHPALRGSSANSVDLRASSGTSSIWRIRSGTSVISGSAFPVISPIAPHATGTVTLSGSMLVVPSGSTPIVLERLADPSRAEAGGSIAVTGIGTIPNPYRPVDVWPTVDQPPAFWIPWPNRPFISHGELLVITSGSLATGTSAADRSLALLEPQILDATYVPSRFAGNAVTTSTSFLASVGLGELSANQLSKWREPGRINVNTIPVASDGSSPVWAALVGGTSVPNPFVSVPPAAPSPATSLGDMLTHPTITDTTAAPKSPFRDARSPDKSFGLAVRIANSATVRSHVFAIWITIRITDSSPNAPRPITKRLFAIYDRSIPVGYAPGLDLNVRNGIRVLRYLD